MKFYCLVVTSVVWLIHLYQRANETARVCVRVLALSAKQIVSAISKCSNGSFFGSF